MGMAAMVSVEEYLKSSYEPDAEYVDGIIEERPAAENPHAAWHSALSCFFGVRAKLWSIRVRPSLRVKIRERLYRIPDVAVLDANVPQDPVAVVPLVAAFEILSPEDRLSRLLVRLADFETMGVPALYVIDPADNAFFRYQAGKLASVTQVEVHGRTVPVQEVIDGLW